MATDDDKSKSSAFDDDLFKDLDDDLFADFSDPFTTSEEKPTEAENHFDTPAAEDPFATGLDPLPDDPEEYQFQSNVEDEENFQFDDEEGFALGDDESLPSEEEAMLPPPSSSAGSPMDSLKDYLNKVKQEDTKKLILPGVIGGLGFLFIIYFFIGLFSGEETATTPIDTRPAVVADATFGQPLSVAQPTPEPESVAPPVEDITLPRPQKTKPSAAESENSAMISRLVTFQTSLEKRATSLEQENARLNEKLATLAQQNADNLSQINNLSRGIRSVQSEVGKLSTLFGQLIDAVKKQQAARPTPSPMMRPSASVSSSSDSEPRHQVVTHEPVDASQAPLFVQAVIPGRAWLKDPSGKVYSVALGDNISGYGRVTDINAKTGLVITSSGAHIEYGIDQF